MGGRPWEADRVQSGQKSGCPIRGLRSGLLLSRALLDWGLGLRVWKEVSQICKMRCPNLWGAARQRLAGSAENATILHNFNQTALAGAPLHIVGIKIVWNATILRKFSWSIFEIIQLQRVQISCFRRKGCFYSMSTSSVCSAPETFSFSICLEKPDCQGQKLLSASCETTFSFR